jgi:SAM-dependent methyltransferase
MTNPPDDKWLAGDAYEAYMGRWTRPLARAFLDWLQPPPSAHWLDVGCGTGALTSAICERGDPAAVIACDPSEPFVAHARTSLPDARATCVVAGVDALPRHSGGFDVAVSGLVLNFLPDPAVAVTSIYGRLRPGGIVAAYVWDYAEGMEWLRYFWDDAVALDPRAAALDEGRRFPLCRRPVLAEIFEGARLAQVETHPLEIPTDFVNFDDYWTPFLRGTGPAPSYLTSLDAPGREALRDRLCRRFQAGGDQRIRLRARAWAVRGVVPFSPGAEPWHA